LTHEPPQTVVSLVDIIVGELEATWHGKAILGDNKSHHHGVPYKEYQVTGVNVQPMHLAACLIASIKSEYEPITAGSTLVWRISDKVHQLEGQADDGSPACGFRTRLTSILGKAN
jgi:hypothetical protein